MATNDYKSILTQALIEYGELDNRKHQITVEMERKFQFILATLNLLDEEDKAEFADVIRIVRGQAEGLSAAVRRVLTKAPGKWHTATSMRDELVESGFDFTGYTSNPLASVHAVMKRLKPEEFAMGSVDGVMAWRWVETEQDPNSPHRRRLVNRPVYRTMDTEIKLLNLKK
jgi:hypothetical protein